MRGGRNKSTGECAKVFCDVFPIYIALDLFGFLLFLLWFCDVCEFELVESVLLVFYFVWNFFLDAEYIRSVQKHTHTVKFFG